MKIKKALSNIFIVIIMIFLIGVLGDVLINGPRYYLEPASPYGVRLYTRSSGLGFVSYSHVYIQYSMFNTKDTGVVFSEDDGPGLSSENADYIIEWLDDYHVSVSFKGNSYTGYRTEIIQY